MAFHLLKLRSPAGTTMASTVVLVFLFLVVGVLGGYFLGMGQKNNSNTNTVATTTVTNSTTTNASTSATRAIIVPEDVQLHFSIPETWSVVYTGEARRPATGAFSFQEFMKNPTASVALDMVKYGDINGEQVDFYYTDKATTDLVTEFKANYVQEGSWSKETVAGTTADVWTDTYLGAGQVTKDATGGNVYVLPVGNLDKDNVNATLKTIVIWKQAKGGAVFESGFAALLASLTLAD